MAESLGEKLRKAREDKDISISEVAEQTRISALYLEAIENDDYKPLPGGIFNKGFVKSFAKYVGVDESEALQDYARIVASQAGSENDHVEKYKPQVLTDDRSGPSLIPTIIFSVIILGLLVWGVMLLVNYLKQMPAGSPGTQANTAANADNAQPEKSKTPLPPLDEIKLKISTGSDAVSVSADVDGRSTSVLIPANSERDFTGKDKVKVNYYKGLAGTLSLTLNGTKLETPIPPEAYKDNGFEFEINQGNIRQILEQKKIVRSGAPNAGNNGANSNASGEAADSNS